MNRLRIKQIRKAGNRLTVEICKEGLWKRYIQDDVFWAEYSVDITSTPDAILIVPFLGNVLPIAWKYNLGIEVDELDKSFYDNLNKVLDGYKKMYPSYSFDGYLDVKRIIDNSNIDSKKEVCFFSGGVDAYYTYLRHKDTITGFCTVWGADVRLEDEQGWNNVSNLIEDMSSTFGVDKYMVKSNFKDMLDGQNLSDDLCHHGWNWWHEFQHGMGLISLMAPIAYIDKINKIYIASSYTAEVKNLTCASDPSIDNFISFNNCEVIHDGFESNRQKKIEYIVNYKKKTNIPVELRVCWISKGGKNCCVCEKCCRTMVGILLEDGNINEMGFQGRNANSKCISYNMRYRNYGLYRDWDLLQNVFHQKYDDNSVPSDWRWFYKGGTYSINHNIIFIGIQSYKKAKSSLIMLIKKMLGKR